MQPQQHGKSCEWLKTLWNKPICEIIPTPPQEKKNHLRKPSSGEFLHDSTQKHLKNRESTDLLQTQRRKHRSATSGARSIAKKKREKKKMKMLTRSSTWSDLIWSFSLTKKTWSPNSFFPAFFYEEDGSQTAIKSTWQNQNAPASIHSPLQRPSETRPLEANWGSIWLLGSVSWRSLQSNGAEDR